MVAFLTKLGPCPWSLQPQPHRKQSLLSSRPYPSHHQLPQPPPSCVQKMKVITKEPEAGLRNEMCCG